MLDVTFCMASGNKLDNVRCKAIHYCLGLALENLVHPWWYLLMWYTWVYMLLEM